MPAAGMNGRRRSRSNSGNDPAPLEVDPRVDTLYEQHYRRVLAYCVRRLGRRGSQTAAEVFLVARRRIDEAPRSDGALLWLYRIALSIVTAKTRAMPAGGRTRSSSRRPGAALEVPPIQRADADRALEAAARLGERDREILRLAMWERLPIPAIAFVLGASEAVVDLRLERAGDRLSREYDRLSERDRLRENRRGRRSDR